MGPHPAVAAVRLAVRRALADLDPGARLLVACSGGADSLALLAATCFEARGPAHTVLGVTVDHGLQPGSAAHADRVVAQMRDLGAEAWAVTVEVGTAGGPEAAARSARYAALDAAAEGHAVEGHGAGGHGAGGHGADVILLGHTRDDQAETVLLGLARGSGARSLSGMASVTGRYRRPLLDLTRADTRAACEAEGLEVWEDPHNSDSAYTRVRVRQEVLPVLERELGPGVTEALARTARLLRDDADALDAIADEVLRVVRMPEGLDAARLREQPAAVRRRVLRRTALEAGCPATELFAVHVDAMDSLVTAWRGQRGVDLPGGRRLSRHGGFLRIARSPVAG